MSIPSWARKGAKVVCVDDKPLPRSIIGGDCPPVGAVCVVAGHVHGQLIIAGWPNEFDGEEVGWRVARFRPLISQADDISTHFQALLSTPLKKEEAA